MDWMQLLLVVAGSIITGAITGALSSNRTIAQLQLHQEYNKEKFGEHKTRLDKHDDEFGRVHRRIDDIAPLDCKYPDVSKRNGQGH